MCQGGSYVLGTHRLSPTRNPARDLLLSFTFLWMRQRTRGVKLLAEGPSAENRLAQRQFYSLEPTDPQFKSSIAMLSCPFMGSSWELGRLNGGVWRMKGESEHNHCGSWPPILGL